MQLSKPNWRTAARWVADRPYGTLTAVGTAGLMVQATLILTGVELNGEPLPTTTLGYMKEAGEYLVSAYIISALLSAGVKSAINGSRRTMKAIKDFKAYAIVPKEERRMRRLMRNASTYNC